MRLSPRQGLCTKVRGITDSLKDTRKLYGPSEASSRPPPTKNGGGRLMPGSLGRLIKYAILFERMDGFFSFLSFFSRRASSLIRALSGLLSLQSSDGSRFGTFEIVLSFAREVT